MNFQEIKDCRYVVIGDPIAHSLSPAMQNAAFTAAGLGCPYGKIRVPKEDMREFTDYAREKLKGFNVTVPGKQSVIPFLDHITPNARAAGSVNTVKVIDGELHGDSTDGYGLETAILETFYIRIPGQSFCFLGCGGAVQALAFHFAGLGIRSLYFVNRTLETAESLCRQLKRHFSEISAGCCGLDDNAKIAAFIAESAVLIQATSLGLRPDDPPPINPALLNGSIRCYDTIYKNTAFLKAAAAHGQPHADGRTMLLHQGAKAFEIWTGMKPDVDAMRKALYREIDSRN
jgi:shikimate dehydrogenase